jgi:hypothetical protein
MRMTQVQAECHVCPVRSYVLQRDGAVCVICLGAGCMMWRWAEPASYFTGQPPVDPDPATRRGYCGLAGKPEVA